MFKFKVIFLGALFNFFMLSEVYAWQQSIVCYERADRNITRVVMHLNGQGRVVSLEVVTPEYLWSAPGRPESPRFPEGVSDVSPNLIEKMKSGAATVVAQRSRGGELMQVRFAATAPNSLDVEGFRGSVAILDSFLGGKVAGALYYSGTGNVEVVVALECATAI